MGELPAGFEPPLVTAQRTGLVKEAIWSLYLRPSIYATSSNAGRITYGSLDADHCSGIPQYIDAPKDGQTDYDLVMKSASIGGTTVNAAPIWLAVVDFTK